MGRRARACRVRAARVAAHAAAVRRARRPRRAGRSTSAWGPANCSRRWRAPAATRSASTTGSPLDAAWERIGGPDARAIQGNLDPAALLAPWEVVEREALDVLARAGGRDGHVFNLGPRGAARRPTPTSCAGWSTWSTNARNGRPRERTDRRPGDGVRHRRAGRRTSSATTRTSAAGARRSPEHLAELRERYAAIGERLPAPRRRRPRRPRDSSTRLNADGEGSFRAYLGMKHSTPFIPEGVAAMRADGIDRAVGIVMAPHWSGMSIETYVERTLQAIDAAGRRHRRCRSSGASTTTRRSSRTWRTGWPRRWRRSPTTNDATRPSCSPPTRSRCGRSTTARCAASPATATTACRYEAGLRRTGDLVAERLGVRRPPHRLAVGGADGRPVVGPVGRRRHPRARRRGPFGGRSCAARGSSPTTSRRSTTSTSRRPRRRARRASRSRARGCPTPTRCSATCSPTVVRDHLASIPA